MKRALLAIAAAASVAEAAPAFAQSLGRLFFTAEERAALDARRRARVPDLPSAAAVSPTTRIDGQVLRSGGNSTVWVNGQPVVEGTHPEGMRVQPGRADAGRVVVTPGAGEARVGLKVGQSLDRASGEVRDPVPGEIRITRPQPR